MEELEATKSEEALLLVQKKPILMRYRRRRLGRAHKEMSRAVGVMKPQEAQKAKALCKMKAAKEAGKEYYDPTREDNIMGRDETILALWEEHVKDPIVALEKALKCVWTFCIGGLGPSASRKGVSQ